MVGCCSGQVCLLYIVLEWLMLDNFFEYLVNWNLVMLVVDEVYCILQWGYDFCLEYVVLGQLCQWMLQILFMVLIVIVDDIICCDIVCLLGFNDLLIQVSSFDWLNICYMLMEKFKLFDQLMCYVQDQCGKLGIIYCNSCLKVEDIVVRL